MHTAAYISQFLAGWVVIPYRMEERKGKAFPAATVDSALAGMSATAAAARGLGCRLPASQVEYLERPAATPKGRVKKRLDDDDDDDEE